MRRSVDPSELSEAARSMASWGSVGEAPWRAPEVSTHLERLASALPAGATAAGLPAAVAGWREREAALRIAREAYAAGLARAAVAYAEGERDVGQALTRPPGEGST